MSGTSSKDSKSQGRTVIVQKGCLVGLQPAEISFCQRKKEEEWGKTAEMYSENIWERKWIIHLIKMQRQMGMARFVYLTLICTARPNIRTSHGTIQQKWIQQNIKYPKAVSWSPPHSPVQWQTTLMPFTMEGVEKPLISPKEPPNINIPVLCWCASTRLWTDDTYFLYILIWMSSCPVTKTINPLHDLSAVLNSCLDSVAHCSC